LSCGLLTTNTLAIRFIQVKSIDKILRHLTLELHTWILASDVSTKRHKMWRELPLNRCIKYLNLDKCTFGSIKALGSKHHILVKIHKQIRICEMRSRIAHKLYLLSLLLFWIKNNLSWNICDNFLSNLCWSWETRCHRVCQSSATRFSLSFTNLLFSRVDYPFLDSFLLFSSHKFSTCKSHSMLLDEAVNSIEWYLT
jgi:hypothetical protein